MPQRPRGVARELVGQRRSARDHHDLDSPLIEQLSPAGRELADCRIAPQQRLPIEVCLPVDEDLLLGPGEEDVAAPVEFVVNPA